MGKTYSLKLNDKEIKKVDRFLKKKHTTPSKLLRKALWLYIDEVNRKVNLDFKEKKQKYIKKVNQKVNLIPKEKIDQEVNQVNLPIQVVKNYELLRHYEEEIDWLRNRIEYFEGFCKELHEKSFSKIDTKFKKKPLMSGIRM